MSAQEFIHRVWQALATGTYAGHGEVLQSPKQSEDHVWTGIGEELAGTAPSRLEFARKIMDEIPGSGLTPIDKWFHINIAGINGQYYLIYLGKQTIKEWVFEFPVNETEIAEGTEFEVEVLDTWNMTRTPADISFRICKKSNYLYGDIYKRSLSLPEKPYLALIIKRRTSTD